MSHEGAPPKFIVMGNLPFLREVLSTPEISKETVLAVTELVTTFARVLAELPKGATDNHPKLVELTQKTTELVQKLETDYPQFRRKSGQKTNSGSK